MCGADRSCCGRFSLFNLGNGVVAAGLQTVTECSDIDRADLGLFVKVRDERATRGKIQAGEPVVITCSKTIGFLVRFSSLHLERGW
jgi:hypothetical protein